MRQLRVLLIPGVAIAIMTTVPAGDNPVGSARIPDTKSREVSRSALAEADRLTMPLRPPLPPSDFRSPSGIPAVADGSADPATGDVGANAGKPVGGNSTFVGSDVHDLSDAQHHPPSKSVPYSAPSEYSEYANSYFGGSLQHFSNELPCNCPRCSASQSSGYGCTSEACQARTYPQSAGGGCRRACCREHDGSCAQRSAAARVAAMSRMSPFGSSVNEFMGIQVSNANSSQLMLYDYDFVSRRPELTVRGHRELRNMAMALNDRRYVVRIQATPYEPELATVRRATVVSQLSSLLPETAVEERVLISEPLTRGFDGVDAVPVSFQLIELQNGGAGQQSGGAGQQSGGN